MEAEITEYINACYDYEQQKKLEDVYVTDHIPAPKQYLTNGDEEEEEAAEY